MSAGRIVGKVVEISSSGDLVTDISNEQIAQVPSGLDVIVQCEDHQTRGILPADHGEAAMTLVAVRGTSGFLELQLVGESAQAFLGIRRGAEVIVNWG